MWRRWLICQLDDTLSYVSYIVILIAKLRMTHKEGWSFLLSAFSVNTVSEDHTPLLYGSAPQRPVKVDGSRSLLEGRGYQEKPFLEKRLAASASKPCP